MSERRKFLVRFLTILLGNKSAEPISYHESYLRLIDSLERFKSN